MGIFTPNLQPSATDNKTNKRGLQDKLVKQNGINQLTEIPNNLFPDLRIPSYNILGHMEAIFISFAKVIFNNFKDGDYATRDTNQITNMKDVLILSYYNNLSEELGQYPRVVVQCTGQKGAPFSLANVDARNSIGNDIRTSLKYYSIRMYCMARNYNEANVLAGIITTSLDDNHDIIRKMFGLNKVEFVAQNAPSLVRDKDGIWAAIIDFQVQGQNYWRNTSAFPRRIKQFIFELVGTIKGDLSDPLVQAYAYLFKPIRNDIESKLKAIIDKYSEK